MQDKSLFYYLFLPLKLCKDLQKRLLVLKTICPWKGHRKFSKAKFNCDLLRVKNCHGLNATQTWEHLYAQIMYFDLLATELGGEGGKETVISNKSQQTTWNASLWGSSEISALYVLNTTKRSKWWVILLWVSLQTEKDWWQLYYLLLPPQVKYDFLAFQM